MSNRTYKGIPIISGEMIAKAHKRAREERAAAFRRIGGAAFAPVVRLARAVAGLSRKVDLPSTAAPDGLGRTTSGRGFI